MTANPIDTILDEILSYNFDADEVHAWCSGHFFGLCSWGLTPTNDGEQEFKKEEVRWWFDDNYVVAHRICPMFESAEGRQELAVHLREGTDPRHLLLLILTG